MIFQALRRFVKAQMTSKGTRQESEGASGALNLRRGVEGGSAASGALAQEPSHTFSWRIGLLLTPITLLLFVAIAVLLYHTALGFGFNSDAFVLMDQARMGLISSVSWDHTEHFMPIATLWDAIQFKFFGLHQAAYEIVNIMQHGLIATMVFLLALRFGMGRFQAFLAGLLFLCAGSAYQVVLWSIVGNNYFTSTFLYLLALLVFLHSDGKALTAWACALMYALSLLAHEQSLSLFPACVLASLLLGHRKDTPWRDKIRQSMVRTWPMVIPLFGFLLMKYLMSLQTEVLAPRQSFSELVQGLSGAILQLWSFRGDINAGFGISRFLQIQSQPVAWLVLEGLLLILLLPRLPALSRFLLLWSSGHLLMMQIAIGFSIRRLYIPTAAASIALVEILFHFLGRSPLKGRLLKGCAMILVALFLWPSLIDLEKAQIEWRRADEMTRNLFTSVFQLSRTHQKVWRLLILNPPRRIPVPSFEIFCFKNGLRNLVTLASDDQILRVLLAHTPGYSNNANGSVLMTMPEIARLLTDPKTAGLEIEDIGGNVKRISMRKLRDQGLLQVYSPWVETATPATRPRLGWIRGRRRSSLIIEPGRKLETFLTPPTFDHVWFLISWKQDPDRSFEISIGEAWHKSFSSRDSRAWEYSVEPLPDLIGGKSRIPVSISSTGGHSLRISTFGFLRQRTLISAKTAPEFSWDRENAMDIPPNSVLRLPVPSFGPYHLLQLVYAGDESRKLEVRYPDGGLIELQHEASSHIPWTSAMAKLGAGESILIRATGSRAARIRRIWFPLPEDLRTEAGGGAIRAVVRPENPKPTPTEHDHLRKNEATQPR